jgi:predicted TIM-barrel fold metal-dependent hydrolase
MTSTQTLKPAQTDPFFGRRLDADGHVYLEPPHMAQILGDLGRDPILDFLSKFSGSSEDVTNREKNRSELWSVKGISALGAVSAAERVEALDAMGMRCQLVFNNTFGKEMRLNTDAARAAAGRYNDYAIDWTNRTGGRARASCVMNMGQVEWAVAEAKRLAKAGVKLVTLPSAAPPAGVSPAHSLWDPFWAVLEEADMVAILHLGGGGLISGSESDPMLPDRGWGKSDALKNTPATRAGGEEATSPYFMLVAHMAPELHLQTMVMGGVFERFPALRLGIIEYGASWIGPCVERMDLWVDFMAKTGKTYSMKPSEYVRRNVRVAPFFHENLPKMIERFGMEELYVFSTDYPHLEGSRDPIGKFNKWLVDLPPSYAQKFNIDNAALLFPGLAA